MQLILKKLTVQIPDLEAHRSSYEVILLFKGDVGDSLLEAMRKDHNMVSSVSLDIFNMRQVVQMQWLLCDNLLSIVFNNYHLCLPHLQMRCLLITCYPEALWPFRIHFHHASRSL